MFILVLKLVGTKGSNEKKRGKSGTLSRNGGGAQWAKNGGQAQIEENSYVDVILGAQDIGTLLLSGF